MSLVQLYAFSEILNKPYTSFLNNCITSDTYWLGGQIEISTNKIITDSMIQDVHTKNEESLNLYGGPCNGLEAASIYRHNHNFEQIQLIRNEYFRYYHAVHVIERYWLRYILNPQNEICKRRLMKEFNELTDKLTY